MQIFAEASLRESVPRILKVTASGEHYQEFHVSLTLLSEAFFVSLQFNQH